MQQQRWKQRPDGSNWGDFGPDDQLGRLNLIDAAALRRGVDEVIDCISLCLSLPLDPLGERWYLAELASSLGDQESNVTLQLIDFVN